LKRALLLFPDVKTMTEFVFINHVEGIEMKTKDCSVNGLFTDELLTIAEKKYQAKLVFMRVIH
jgi:hypothetical protein